MKCILIAVVCTGILSCSPRPVAGARTDNKADGGYRFERNGSIYVHLEGAPERLGYQHGYLLADEIRELLRVVGPFFEHTTKRDWNFYRMAAEKISGRRSTPSIKKNWTASSMDLPRETLKRIVGTLLSLMLSRNCRDITEKGTERY